jgi:Domain of unknown function (DUF3885)
MIPTARKRQPCREELARRILKTAPQPRKPPKDDDRGLDLIAAERESLQPVYDAFDEWLLDYDRASADQVFGRPR